MTFISLVPSIYVNAKQYGAIGNGTAADDAAIQAAVTSLPDSGGTVLLPLGNYKLTTSLVTPATMYGGFRLLGAGWGTTLTLANGVNDYVVKFNNSSTNGMVGAEISHLKIDCNGANQTAGGGIDAYGAYRCLFDHVWIHNAYDAGIHLHYGPGGGFGFQNWVRSCFIEGGKNSAGYGRGLWSDNCDENYIFHNLFQDNGGTYGAPNGVDNCHVRDDNGLSTYMGNAFVNGRGGLKIYANRSRIIGNVWDGVGGTGTNAGAGTGGSALAGPNLYLGGPNNMVQGNTFMNVGYGCSGVNGVAGIYCPSANNTIVGNNFETDGSAYNATGALIYLDTGAANCIVEQNNFKANSGSSGYAFVQYGGGVGATDNAVRFNANYKTEAHGSASITSGNTTVVVTHGLAQTPTIDQISITPQTSLGSAAFFWVSTVTSTQFTINLNANPAATVTFGWKVDSGY